MKTTGIIGLILIAANVLFSYRGFKKTSFFDAYKFEVDKILIGKEYQRLISSGFLHINWLHLIFNMFSLYVFSYATEAYLGGFKFALIYFTSLIGGGLLSLFVHRKHGDYSAVGASGAVCGVIFASLALFPGMSVGFFGLPLFIPGWLYGLLYILYSIYGIRSKKDNIGHEAHLGGALIGMLTALLLQPEAFARNYLTILIIAVPALIFIYLIVTRPHTLLIDNYYFKTHQQYYSIDHKYNQARTNRQKEIDRLLDKINQKGINSLNKQEQQMLKEYSEKTE